MVGWVRDCAVFTAVGVDSAGRRSMLGVSVALSEAEVHWRKFFKSLLERGLHGVKLITSDAHAGLKEARQACFHGVPWQRCQFHLLRKALEHVPKPELKRAVMEELRHARRRRPAGGPRHLFRRASRACSKSSAYDGNASCRNCKGGGG